ncbi:neutral/alkaline non-lysosomal ceramidase N-terminal domain-containing protein [Fontimonas sp. SYSU GA230001]|uniref:neutral/alkaline non-lysosomal ceramidase N-terminal domain-containing protein n=1 Tax=Fontimonas sp. SYSU GA230001 TaxID=3142450 RepID=UPI0032B4A214
MRPVPVRMLVLGAALALGACDNRSLTIGYGTPPTPTPVATPTPGPGGSPSPSPSPSTGPSPTPTATPSASPTASPTPSPTLGLPPPQPLMAGVAARALDVPVGTPLGGYLRPPVGGEYIPAFEDLAGGDPSAFFNEMLDFLVYEADDGTPLAPLPDELRALHSPYATYSPPSRGYYDSLIAKAVALYDGHDYVVLVKTDMIGMLDEVVVAVNEKVEADTGIALGDGLLMSATHTHDGPGALANHSTRYFWLAMDVYQPEVFERLVAQLADLVKQALADLQPARFGHAVGSEGYLSRIDDPANPQPKNLNSFRRNVALPGYDVEANDAMRKRLGVLRVDRLDGTPLAVVINYAAHGIAFDVENQYFSGDVLASVEREVEAGFDTPVVAMLVQSAGGNVSPRADGGPTLQRIERFGKLLAPQVRALYDGIDELDDAPDLRAVSQRIVLDAEHLGYPDSDGQHGDGDYPYPWGGVQCNNEAAVPFVGPGTGESIPFCLPAPPPDEIDLADNGVAENGAFVPQDTRVTAVRIGDVMLLAQPGEPLSEYGVRLLAMAQEEGRDPASTFVWGYAQDHVGYILADEKADWEQGGTEGTTTFWGWRLGARLLDVNRALLRALRDRSAPPADEFSANYFYRDLPYAPAQATPSLMPGRVIEQPAPIERFQTAVFSWEGGDPVVDAPRVRLQRRTAPGLFEDARRANGTAIDTLFEMHLKYRLAAGVHLWTVELEPPKDWPAGEYRFVVDGHALAVSSDYAVTSAPFTISTSPSLQLSPPVASADGLRIEATLAYTPRPHNYRLIDVEVKTDRPAPVREGRVVFSDGANTVEATQPSIEAREGRLVAVYSAPAAAFAGTVSATGFDRWGNSAPLGAAKSRPVRMPAAAQRSATAN